MKPLKTLATNNNALSSFDFEENDTRSRVSCDMVENPRDADTTHNELSKIKETLSRFESILSNNVFIRNPEYGLPTQSSMEPK